MPQRKEKRDSNALSTYADFENISEQTLFLKKLNGPFLLKKMQISSSKKFRYHINAINSNNQFCVLQNFSVHIIMQQLSWHGEQKMKWKQKIIVFLHWYGGSSFKSKFQMGILSVVTDNEKWQRAETNRNFFQIG